MTRTWVGAPLVDRFVGFGLGRPARQCAASIRATVALWSARYRRRMNLAAVAALGERTMLDLGFDPDVVRAEAAKPFWRL